MIADDAQRAPRGKRPDGGARGGREPAAAIEAQIGTCAKLVELGRGER